MIDRPVRIFEAVPSLIWRRSERSLCALLLAFLKNGHVDRLQEAVDRSVEEYGIAPGIASYNIVLKARCSSNKVDEAFSLLDEMPGKGLEPNIIRYNTVLDKGNVSGFDKFLEEIAGRNLAEMWALIIVGLQLLLQKVRAFRMKIC